MIPFPYQIGQAGIGGGRRGQEGVALLLHMDGMQGSNTFVDSSTPANVFTALGGNGAVISTAQSVFGGASGLFNGTTAFVSTPDATEFTLGTMDFCVDFWVRHNSVAGTQAYFGHGQAAAAGSSILIVKNNTTNTVTAQVYSGGTSIALTSTTALVVNQNYHIAYTRQGSVFRLFINGVQEATVTSALAVNDSLNNLSIGRNGDQNAAYYNGYIDEFRFVVGQAVYTANFTPPVMPYDPIMDFPDETVILLHFDGPNNSTVFEDSSFYSRAFSEGKPVITNSQFVFGQSGLFNGTTSYIQTPDSEDFTIGTQDFCLDFWVRLNVAGTTQQLFCGQADAAVSAASQSFSVQYRGGAAGTLQNFQAQVNSGATAYNISGTVKNRLANQWYHIAFTRQGTALRLFVDGIDDGQLTLPANLNINNSVNPLAIGRNGLFNSLYLNGYIDEFRLVIGSPVYTTNFTPPTVPYPNP